MNKEEDNKLSFLGSIGAILVAVGVGYVLYRIGKKVYKYYNENGETEIISYKKEEIISDYYATNNDIINYES